MLKYQNSLTTFTEVPDEIALCFNMYGCPFHCQDCFEPWLQRKDLGTPLTLSIILDELDSHPYTTCVCFMGGDSDYCLLFDIMKELKRLFPKIKLAMYTGASEMNPLVASLVNYYKIGPYIPQKGPLNSKTTNQRMYYRESKEDNWTDITYKFQKSNVL